MFLLDRLVKYTELRCLIIYRDPRDVAHSTIRKSKTAWKGRAFAERMNTPTRAAESWLKAMRPMEANKDKIFTVRYEDLVLGTDQTLAGLAEWLQVDPAGFPHDIIHEKGIGRYQKGLKPEQAKEIEAIAGSTMQRYGYQIS